MSEHKYILAVSITAALAATFYVMRSRKKRASNVVSEKFFRTRNASWLSLTNLLSPSEDGWDHPEGPNIGFESNTSWFTKQESETPAKIDLLHRGHTKGGKLVIVMCGVPGRGKTYLARKVARYLRWINYRTRVFSLAKYR